MKKDLFFPAILVGILFAALYIYLVAEFATSAYSFLYFVVIPIPLALQCVNFPSHPPKSIQITVCLMFTKTIKNSIKI